MTGIINFESAATREIRHQTESLTLIVIFRNFKKSRKWNSLLISYLQKSISMIYDFPFLHSVSFVGRCFLIPELPGPKECDAQSRRIPSKSTKRLSIQFRVF